jgi:hypothetical protein
MEKPLTDETKDEKRRLNRVHFVTEITFTLAGKTSTYTETRNLSMTGVFVVTGDPLALNSEGEFVLTLKMGESGGIPIKGWFKVANHHKTEGEEGMGIKFVRMGTDDSLNLYKVIRYNNPE